VDEAEVFLGGGQAEAVEGQGAEVDDLAALVEGLVGGQVGDVAGRGEGDLLAQKGAGPAGAAGGDDQLEAPVAVEGQGGGDGDPVDAGLQRRDAQGLGQAGAVAVVLGPEGAPARGVGQAGDPGRSGGLVGDAGDDVGRGGPAVEV